MGNPLKKPKKGGKGCFFTAGICICTVVFKLKIYKLQMFSIPSDTKCFFVSLNFILNYAKSRGVFRTQSNIYNGVFCKNI